MAIEHGDFPVRFLYSLPSRVDKHSTVDWCGKPTNVGLFLVDQRGFFHHQETTLLAVFSFDSYEACRFWWDWDGNGVFFEFLMAQNETVLKLHGNLKLNRSISKWNKWNIAKLHLKTGVDDFQNKKTLGFSIGGFELGPYILPRKWNCISKWKMQLRYLEMQLREKLTCWENHVC